MTVTAAPDHTTAAAAKDDPAGQITADGRRAWRAVIELNLHGENHSNFPRACAEYDLPPSAGKALFLLSESRPTAMRELAAAFACDASYITAVVDALEQRGLAVRRPHPTDRRVRTVVLTPEGASSAATLMERIGQPPAAVAVLTAEEQHRLAELLEKVAGADTRLQQHRADA